MNCDKKDLLLYAVTDRAWLNGETLCSQVEKAIKGGATFIQLREKNLDQKHFLEEALEIQKLCKKYNVPLIVDEAHACLWNFNKHLPTPALQLGADAVVHSLH